MFDWIKDFFTDMEYDSTAKRVGKIIVTGIVAAPALYILASVLNLVACFFSCGNYGCPTGDCRYGSNSCFPSEMWSASAFGYTLLFLSIAGIVIGVVYAIGVQVQKNIEERENNRIEQRKEYALEFKRRSDKAISECVNYKNLSEKKQLQPNFSAVALQENVWDALDDASTSLKKLDGIVNELKIKEGK